MTLHHTGTRRRLLVALGAIGGLAACDYPTSLPIWDTTWEIPVDSTRLTVDSLLPAAVRVAEDGSAFLLTLDPVGFGRSLGEVCGPCAALQGATAPKPAFTLTGSGLTQLPADVAQVALAGGRLTISVANGFGFDPLRPSASARGTLTLSVTHAGQTLVSSVVNGTDTAFPSGTSLVRQLALPTADISGPVTVALTISSPAGDAVRIDTAQRVTLAATVDTARVASASVRVQSRTVAFEEVELDLEDVESDVAERVQSGALLLEVVNPFAVAGTFTVTITAPTLAITRTITVPSGTSTPSIALSGAELRALLGASPVTFAATGTVSAPGAGFVTLQPGQALRVATRVRATIRSEAP